MSRNKKQAQRIKRHRRALLNEPSGQLEQLWDELLSRKPERVRAAYNSLDLPGQKAVLTHLQHVATEVGWQPEQRQSALAAIQALEGQSKQEDQ